MADAIHDLTAPYALDALDERERAEFEAHLATCEDCRRQLQEFWGVAEALAHGAPAGPVPPPQLRERILTAAGSERSNVVPLPRRRALTAAVAAAAAASILAAGLGVWSFSLARDLDRERDAASARTGALAVLADPDARRVALTTPHGNVVVTPAGDAALVLQGVEPAPAGKVYEIWVVEDGQPRSAGVFDGAPSRTVVPVDLPVPEGATVAITLEDEAGTPAPEGPRVTATPPL
jgi:anti-sigma-K factor RskA